MDDSQMITSSGPLVSDMFAELRFARSIGSRLRKPLSRSKDSQRNSPQMQFNASHEVEVQCANSGQSFLVENLGVASSFNCAQQQALNLNESEQDRGGKSIQNSGIAEFFEPMRRVQKEESYPWPAPKLFGTL